MGTVALLTDRRSFAIRFKPATALFPQFLPPRHQVVVLPECWNSPYATASFPVYAEPVPEPGDAKHPPCAKESPSTSMLCRAAAENKVFLVGGSVPEVGGDGGVYNTCVVVDPDGRIVAKHRKVHLFDIDVPGGITFKWVS